MAEDLKDAVYQGDRGNQPQGHCVLWCRAERAKSAELTGEPGSAQQNSVNLRSPIPPPSHFAALPIKSREGSRGPGSALDKAPRTAGNDDPGATCNPGSGGKGQVVPCAPFSCPIGWTPLHWLLERDQ